MANPSFWFYAHDGTLTEIQLPGPLTEFSWVPLRDRRSGWTLAGDMKSAVHTGRLRVTITLGPFNDSGSFQHLAYQLENMSAHLERGLPISFAVDREKCWLSEALMTIDSNVVEYGTNVCSVYNSSASFTTGDIMAVESPNPELYREYVRVASMAAVNPTFTAAAAVLYDYQETPVVLRHRDFFPVLYMPEDQLGNSLVTHEHRQTFTLDLTLEQSIDGQAALVSSNSDFMMDRADIGAGMQLHGSTPAEDSADGAQGGYSLQRAIEAGRPVFGTSRDANVEMNLMDVSIREWSG